ncbi:MAG: PAS domain S-box protein [PVC group bacterium]
MTDEQLREELNFFQRQLAVLRKRAALRRKLLKKVRENYRQCAAIVNNVKDGIFVETVHGRILDVNDAVCRMLGYSKKELLSMRVGDLVPPEVAARLPEIIRAETVREGVYIETVDIRKDGTPLPVEVSNTLIEIGGEKRVIAIIHDISERVSAREKLLAAYGELEKRVEERTEELGRANRELQAEIAERKAVEEKLREEHGLFIGGPTVVLKWKAAPGWPVEYVSPNIRSQFGYTPEALTDGDILYASIVHPDDLSRVAEEVKTYGESGKVCFEQCYRIRAAGGRYRWVSDFTVVSRDNVGEITHYHGYVVDITDRIRNEQELRKHREHLEELVVKRTAELESMVDAMARRVVRMSDLEIVVEGLKKQLRDAGLLPFGEEEEERSGE